MGGVNLSLAPSASCDTLGTCCSKIGCGTHFQTAVDKLPREVSTCILALNVLAYDSSLVIYIHIVPTSEATVSLILDSLLLGSNLFLGPSFKRPPHNPTT